MKSHHDSRSCLSKTYLARVCLQRLAHILKGFVYKLQSALACKVSFERVARKVSTDFAADSLSNFAQTKQHRPFSGRQLCRKRSLTLCTATLFIVTPFAWRQSVVRRNVGVTACGHNEGSRRSTYILGSTAPNLTSQCISSA